jgi:hypothetical protein
VVKKLLVAMVVGAVALTACAQRGIDLGAPVSTESEKGSGKSAPDRSQKRPRQKSKVSTAARKAPEAVESTVSQSAVECSPAAGGGDHVAQLTEVRVGRHDGYDRVVFEFAPPENAPWAFGIPRYQMSRIAGPITDDPSGQPVAVDGDHYASIVFHGGTAIDMTTSDPKGYELTYRGPREIKPGYAVLAEAQETGDFEATMTWAFGLNRASCWRVSVLEDPARVVVDFLH